MARPLRIEYEGALYHLCGRGNRRERIFEDEQDCHLFLELLAESLPRYQVALHAFVLMGNHYHLLAQTKQANLGRWMHWLVTSYTIGFNGRHRRVGHLFQGRYKSIVVEAEGYLLSLSRYLHLNPVRGAQRGRGELKERRERLRAWRWSSYRGYAGLAKPEAMVSEELLFGEFGARRNERRVRYRRFVEEGLLEVVRSPFEEAKWQAVLGSEDFQQRMRDRLEDLPQRRREVKAVREVLDGGKLREKIVKLVAGKYGLTAKGVREQSGRSQEAKGVAMTLVWDRCGMSLRELGEYFGGLDYAAAAQQIHRTRQRAAQSRLQKGWKQLQKNCQGI